MIQNVSDIERYSVFLWSGACGVTSVIGNLTVLLAAVVFRALKLDKVSLVLIANLATADLITGITAILPSIGTSLTGRWIYGEFLCQITNYTESVSMAASIGLLCAINVAKLTSLLCPLRARTRSKKSGYTIATVIWVVSLFVIIPYFFFEVSVSFDIVMMRCHKEPVEELDRWFKPILTACLVFVPLLLINITTVWLLYFVHSVRGLQKQSVVTVILISIIFTVAFLPYGLIMLNAAPKGLWFVKLAIYTPFLNCTMNPIVYFFTISSFRDFVLYRLKLKKKRAGPSPVFYRSKASSMMSHVGEQVVSCHEMNTCTLKVHDTRNTGLSDSTETFCKA